MNWRPSNEVDEEVRRWMKSKGWEVTISDAADEARGAKQLLLVSEP